MRTKLRTRPGWLRLAALLLTLVAIATPPGRGGIGIVRVSGSATRGIAEALLGKLPAARHATFADFLDATGQPLDQGLALFFVRRQIPLPGAQGFFEPVDAGLAFRHGRLHLAYHINEDADLGDIPPDGRDRPAGSRKGGLQCGERSIQVFRQIGYFEGFDFPGHTSTSLRRGIASAPALGLS